MQKTSIHFSPIKSNSEVHNFRKIKYDYVREDLSKNNEYWIEEKIFERQIKIEDYCKKKSGRKLQCNAIPIREAVVVIKENTTMFDLTKFAKELESNLKIRVFQIAIHKDEGHYDIDTKIWTPNYHAHLVADWQDLDTGKTLKHKRLDYSKMQDLAAETLGMERGKSDGLKRLNSIQFKIKEKEEELSKLVEKISEITDALKANDFTSLNMVKNGFLGIERTSVELTIENFSAALLNLNADLLSKKTEIENLRKSRKEQLKENEELKKDNQNIIDAYKNLLWDNELYSAKRKNEYETLLNLVEKNILLQSFRFKFSEDSEVISNNMTEICKKISTQTIFL